MIPIKTLSVVHIKEWQLSLLQIILLTIGILEVSLLNLKEELRDTVTLSKINITLKTSFNYNTNFVSLQIAEFIIEGMLLSVYICCIRKKIWQEKTSTQILE